MSSKSLLLISIIIGIAFSETCPKYSCAKDGVVDPNDLTICAQLADGTWLIGNCPAGQFCDMNDNVNTTIHCHQKITRMKLAGEKFENSPAECFTGQADEEGYCRGNKFGGTCSANGDADCDVNLYCNSDTKHCEDVLLYDHACTWGDQCASYLTCSFNDGLTYLCKPYGYYENGLKAGIAEEDGICKSNFINPDNYVCETGPKLLEGNLRDGSGEPCNYDFGDSDLSRCLYHKDGYGVCRRGIGELQEYWNIVVDYLKRKPACHVSIPYAQCDMGRKVCDSDEEFQKIWMAITKVHWESQIEGIADCVKQYVHPEAFKFEKKSFGTTQSLTGMAIIAMLIMLLAI